MVMMRTLKLYPINLIQTDFVFKKQISPKISDSTTILPYVCSQV